MQYNRTPAQVEALQRVIKIRHLRGIWTMAPHIFESDYAIATHIRHLVDWELEKLGAEPEGIRRERYTRALEARDPAVYNCDMAAKEEKAEGRRRYKEWKAQKKSPDLRP